MQDSEAVVHEREVNGTSVDPTQRLIAKNSGRHVSFGHDSAEEAEVKYNTFHVSVLSAGEIYWKP